MPMTLIYPLKTEKSVATLARRIFAIPEDGKREAQARAERAILKANPRLKAKEGFVPGSDIVVPAATGLGITDEVRHVGPGVEAASPGDIDMAAAASAIPGETRLRLRAARARIEKHFEVQAAGQQARIALLDDEKFMKAVSSATPEVLPALEQAGARLKEELEQQQERAKLLKAGLEKAEAAFGRLAQHSEFGKLLGKQLENIFASESDER